MRTRSEKDIRDGIKLLTGHLRAEAQFGVPPDQESILVLMIPRGGARVGWKIKWRRASADPAHR
jgi:hypothetical protein